MEDDGRGARLSSRHSNLAAEGAIQTAASQKYVLRFEGPDGFSGATKKVCGAPYSAAAGTGSLAVTSWASHSSILRAVYSGDLVKRASTP